MLLIYTVAAFVRDNIVCNNGLAPFVFMELANALARTWLGVLIYACENRHIC